MTLIGPTLQQLARTGSAPGFNDLQTWLKQQSADSPLRVSQTAWKGQSAATRRVLGKGPIRYVLRLPLVNRLPPPVDTFQKTLAAMQAGEIEPVAEHADLQSLDCLYLPIGQQGAATIIPYSQSMSLSRFALSDNLYRQGLIDYDQKLMRNKYRMLSRIPVTAWRNLRLILPELSLNQLYPDLEGNNVRWNAAKGQFDCFDFAPSQIIVHDGVSIKLPDVTWNNMLQRIFRAFWLPFDNKFSYAAQIRQDCRAMQQSPYHKEFYALAITLRRNLREASGDGWQGLWR